MQRQKFKNNAGDDGSLCLVSAPGMGSSTMCHARFSSAAVLCAVLAAVCIPRLAAAQANYLVPLGTDSTAARGLNNSGQALLSSGLYSNGTFTPFPAGFTGFAINANGHVAGTNAAGDLALYSGGVVTDLAAPPGLPPPSGGVPNAFVWIGAINSSDDIVGTTFDDYKLDAGFLYSGGVLTSIQPVFNTAGEEAEADGLNDSGLITGCQDSIAGYPNEAYLYANGIVTDLGAGCGAAINASGQIAGNVSGQIADGSYHAAIFHNGAVNVFSEPPPFNASGALAINGSGQLVGTMQWPAGVTHPGSGEIGFFYDGVMVDINRLISASDPLKGTVTIESGVAINDSRLMLVSGHDPLGNYHAYLLQAPWLDLAPGPLTFVSLPPGTTSATQVITLTNSGTAPLPLDSISSSSTTVLQTSACPGSLAPGADCTVSVSFTPDGPGDFASELDVVTAGATIPIPISGTGSISIHLSANPTDPAVGQPFVITWDATAKSSCLRSGGGANDGWNVNGSGGTQVGTSGSVQVMEAQASSYTYILTCSAGSVGQQQSLVVNVKAAPPPTPALVGGAGGGGGGGALGAWELFVLSGLLCFSKCRDAARRRE